MHIAKDVVNWVAFVLGLVAAYMWFKASTARVVDANNPHNPGIEMSYEDPKNPGQHIQVVASAMEQSRLNKIAAIYTGFAVLAQAVASVLP